jgi:putative addiction module antidote
MSMTAKVTKVGNSSAIILPKEWMAKLNLEQGDSVSLTDHAEGLVISPYDSKKARQLELARKVMKENRNMLKKLAE